MQGKRAAEQQCTKWIATCEELKAKVSNIPFTVHILMNVYQIVCRGAFHRCSVYMSF